MKSASARKHLGRNPEEAGESTTLDVVIAKTKAQDVFSNDLAAVVLDLVIALRRCLRSQQVRPHRKSADVDRYRIVSERQTCVPRTASRMRFWNFKYEKRTEWVMLPVLKSMPTTSFRV